MRQAVAAGRAWLQAHGMARALPAALAGGPPGLAQNIHAGGGSTVILGLIGLGLVVGWRSRTRVGAFLRDQMVAFLVFTALIGIVGMKIVDNYGHAGGAIAGAVLGFFHRGLVRSAERGGRGRRLAGWASALVLLGCIGGQSYAARGNLAEARRIAAHREAIARLRQVDAVLIPSLVGLQVLTERVAFDRAVAAFEDSARRGDPTLALDSDYGYVLEVLAQLGPVARPPAVRAQELVALRAVAEQLAAIGPDLEQALVNDSYRDAVAIARDLGTGPIDSRRHYALRVDLGDLLARAKRARDDWKARRDALEAAAATR
jgi:hypothetical protein